MNNKGFTLIELLLVMAIMMIVGSFSTPLYSRFLVQNSVDNHVNQLASQFRKAQLYSMIGRQNGNWGVTISEGNIILFQGDSFATRNTALDERFALNSSISISGFTEVVYTRVTGLPSATPTITLRGNNSVKTITVNSMGVVNK